jgi:molybdate transport system substrate-binding protein
VEFNVYAAASTRDALLKIGALYEASHNARIFFNFGSSGDLSRQIIASPGADLFLSADEIEMDRLHSASLLVTGTRGVLFSNQLVVIEPVGAESVFRIPFSPGQLSSVGIRRLSLANVATVPAGRYAKAWLEQTGVWASLENRILPAVDVRAALAAVESGGAQAGIVYRTDVARSLRARIVFAVPRSDGPQILYSVAAIAGGAAEREALSFLNFLRSVEAQRIVEEFGFIPVVAPAL